MQATEHADLDWPAPEAAAPVRASVRLPGSKSITNRALILAALASEPTTIIGPLQARDTGLMAGSITALGASVLITGHDQDGNGAASAGQSGGTPPTWTITPGLASGPVRVEVGNAGTVLRFVPPAAALVSGDVEFSGDPRAARRPVGQLLAALRQAGAEVNDGGRGAVPFIVHGRGAVRGGTVTLDASASSQLVSGLLLAAPCYDKGAELRHEGPRMPSAPHLAMTVQMLRDAGAEVETGSRGRGGTGGGGSVPDMWRVHPGVLAPGTITVEPDLSNAGPFLAAALVTAGTVTVAGWPPRTSQPAAQILDVLTRMGAVCTQTADGMRVTGSGEIRGVTADLADVSELTPVLTALAALASGPSVFTGIGHQRAQECDRLAALAGEIGALGGDIAELPDGLAIRPRPLRADGAVFASHDDHRLVMAAAVLALAVPGLRVQNAATVGKTFPGFTGAWAAMLERAS